MDWGTFFPEQFAVYALEAAGELQGLRMLEVSEDDVERYGIHAMRLSTAPWNRPPVRRYDGVGSLLVGIAILRSQQDTYGGNVHCESLPGAEAFHERNGMANPFTQSSDEIAQLLSPEPGADSIGEQDLHAVVESERFPWLPEVWQTG
jgi:hypothetical protein